MLKYLITAIMLASASCASPAVAKDECTNTSDFYDVLTVGFDMSRVSVGTKDDLVIENWASAETGRWAIIVTNLQTDVTCLVAEGFNYLQLNRLPNV